MSSAQKKTWYFFFHSRLFLFLLSLSIYESSPFILSGLLFLPYVRIPVAISRSVMGRLFQPGTSSSTLLSEGSRHHLSDRPFICPSVVGRSVGRWVLRQRRSEAAARAGCNSQQRALSPSLGEEERESERERDRASEWEEGTEGSRELYRPTSLSSSIPATEP